MEFEILLIAVALVFTATETFLGTMEWVYRGEMTHYRGDYAFALFTMVVGFVIALVPPIEWYWAMVGTAFVYRSLMVIVCRQVYGTA